LKYFIHLIFVFFLLIFSNCSQEEYQTDRPNILFILVDDLGFADLSIHGSEDVLTPNIDSIAVNGMQFDQAYVSAPQCSPSRAGIISGIYQQRFGHEANPEVPFMETFGLEPKIKTMATHLKNEGYQTFGFGKWDLGSIPSAQPWNRGFDYFYGHYAGARSFFAKQEEKGYAAMIDNKGYIGQKSGYLTDLITHKAIKTIKNSNRNKPWFAFMSYLAPHWPMDAKKDHLNVYSHIPDLHRRTFCAMMHSLDENIGRLLSFISSEGIDDNTIVVFLSDNGGPTGRDRINPEEAFQYGKNASRNDPFRGVKGELFEGGIRIPFFIKWPGVLKKGSRYVKPVISLDLLPTFLGMADADNIPVDIDGVNLVPFITGENTKRPHDVLYWRWFNQWAIRINQWKLVIVDHDKRYLFNLVNDLEETSNIISEHPHTYQQLLSSLKHWNNELEPARWRYPEQEKILSRKLE